MSDDTDNDTGSRSERVSYSTYGDINGQVSILSKALCHGWFKDEAVVIGDDTGYALMDAAWGGLPRELPALAHQLQLVPAAEAQEKRGRGWKERLHVHHCKCTRLVHSTFTHIHTIESGYWSPTCTCVYGRLHHEHSCLPPVFCSFRIKVTAYMIATTSVNYYCRSNIFHLPKIATFSCGFTFLAWSYLTLILFDVETFCIFNFHRHRSRVPPKTYQWQKIDSQSTAQTLSCIIMFSQLFTGAGMSISDQIDVHSKLYWTVSKSKQSDHLNHELDICSCGQYNYSVQNCC